MINWVIKHFNELSPHELYTIMQLRNEVFVVEQNCVYPDADNKDQLAYHLMGWMNEKLIAYTRLLPAGIAYPGYASIGRVATAASARGKGIGKELMNRSIEYIENLFGRSAIKIGAQLYLKKFYTEFGFNQSSHVYLEDGIEHIEMIKD